MGVPGRFAMWFLFAFGLMCMIIGERTGWGMAIIGMLIVDTIRDIEKARRKAETPAKEFS